MLPDPGARRRASGEEAVNYFRLAWSWEFPPISAPVWWLHALGQLWVLMLWSLSTLQEALIPPECACGRGRGRTHSCQSKAEALGR